MGVNTLMPDVRSSTISTIDPTMPIVLTSFPHVHHITTRTRTREIGSHLIGCLKHCAARRGSANGHCLSDHLIGAKTTMKTFLKVILLVLSFTAASGATYIAVH